MEYYMKKKYSQHEIQQGFENLAKLKKENIRLKIIIDKLQNEVVVYRAREVADYMRDLGYSDREACAALNILKRHIDKSS